MPFTLEQNFTGDVFTPLIVPQYEEFLFIADDGTSKESGRLTMKEIGLIADHPIRVRGCGNQIDDRARYFHAYGEAPLLKSKRYGCLFGITSGDIATTGRVFQSFASTYRMAEAEAYSVQDEEFNLSTVLVVPLVRPVTQSEWIAGQEALIRLFEAVSLPVDRYRCLNPEESIPTASFASCTEQNRYARTGFRVDIVQR